MVFDWLFRKPKLDGQEQRDAWEKKGRQEQVEASFASLSPAKRRLAIMSKDLPHGEDVRKFIATGQDQELKVHLQNNVMPKVDAKTREQLARLGQESAWATPEEVREGGLGASPPPIDSLILGSYEDEDGDEAHLQFYGEGHLLTVAMTGAGKGQGHILPNLFAYTGSAIVFDPKGEAYEHTAWRRQLYGKVFKWAPYATKPDGSPDSDSFNPLDYVKGYREALVLADLLVDPAEYGRDPFWDRSARDLLVATILFVKRTCPPERQNMREVMRWLWLGPAKFETFVDDLRASDDELLNESANEVEEIPPNLRTSIYQNLRSHLGPWRSDEITAVTSATTPDWWIPDFRHAPELEEEAVATGNRPMVGCYAKTMEGSGEQVLVRGMSRTAYIIIPTHEIRSHAPVLRVILGLHLQQLINLNPLGEIDPSNPGRPVLFVLDELPQLGYMQQIEQAIATARSAKMRLWLFVQDLNQLRQHYKGWETIIANCRVKSYFKVNDLTTARYIAERVGKVQSLFGGEEYAASPQDIMGDGFRDELIVEAPGMKPVRARLNFFYRDPLFKDAVPRKEDVIRMMGMPEHNPVFLELDIDDAPVPGETGQPDAIGDSEDRGNEAIEESPPERPVESSERKSKAHRPPSFDD